MKTNNSTQCFWLTDYKVQSIKKQNAKAIKDKAVIKGNELTHFKFSAFQPQTGCHYVHHVLHDVQNVCALTVVDKTLTPSPWTTLMDYPNGLP